MLEEPKRLTERNTKTGLATLKYKDGLACGTLDICGENCNDCNAHRCDAAIAVERLAKYEDTWLTPDDIIKLQEKLKTAQNKLKKMSVE